MAGYPTIRLDDINNKDIETYVQTEFQRMFRDTGYKLESVADLEMNIIRQTQGVFLWVKLVMNEFTENNEW